MRIILYKLIAIIESIVFLLQSTSGFAETSFQKQTLQPRSETFDQQLVKDVHTAAVNGIAPSDVLQTGLDQAGIKAVIDAESDGLTRDIASEVMGVDRNPKDGDASHMEGLPLKKGEEIEWAEHGKGNPRIKKITLRPKLGSKIDFSFENKILDYYKKFGFKGRDEFSDYIENVMNRLTGVYCPGIEKLYLGLLTKSEYLFEDHTCNGLIGMNKQLFLMDISDELRKKIFELGIIHELRHENGTKDSESEMVIDDVIMAFHRGITMDDINELKKVGVFKEDSRFFIERERLLGVLSKSLKFNTPQEKVLFILELYKDEPDIDYVITAIKILMLRQDCGGVNDNNSKRLIIESVVDTIFNYYKDEPYKKSIAKIMNTAKKQASNIENPELVSRIESYIQHFSSKILSSVLGSIYSEGQGAKDIREKIMRYCNKIVQKDMPTDKKISIFIMITKYVIEKNGKTQQAMRNTLELLSEIIDLIKMRFYKRDDRVKGVAEMLNIAAMLYKGQKKYDDLVKFMKRQCKISYNYDNFILEKDHEETNRIFAAIKNAVNILAEDTDTKAVLSDLGFMNDPKDLPVNTENDVCITKDDISKYFIGNVDEIIQKMYEELGGFDLMAKRVVIHEDSEILFYKTKTNENKIVWSFNVKDIALVAEVFDLKLIADYETIGEDEMPLESLSDYSLLKGSYEKGFRIIRAEELSRGFNYDYSEKEHTTSSNGHSVTFYARKIETPAGWKITWAFKTKDLYEIPKLDGMQLFEEYKEVAEDEVEIDFDNKGQLIPDVAWPYLVDVSEWLLRRRRFKKATRDLIDLEVVSMDKAKVSSKGYEMFFYIRRSGRDLCVVFNKAELPNLIEIFVKDSVKSRHNGNNGGGGTARGMTESEAMEIIKQQLGELFTDDVRFLAARYGCDAKNILWGIIGYKLEKYFDADEISTLIDRVILQSVDQMLGVEQETFCLAQMDEGKKPSEKPKIYESKPLSQEDIQSLAGRIQGIIDREIIEKGTKEITTKQAVVFIKKLERNLFFREFFTSDGNKDIIQNTMIAMERILSATPKDNIVYTVLSDLLEEVKQALVLIGQLYEAGLKKTTNLNLYQIYGVFLLLQNKKEILADEMGLGKTLQAISAFLLSGEEEMLIAAPFQAISRWVEDLVKHTDTELDLIVLSDYDPTSIIGKNPKIHVTRLRGKAKYDYLFKKRKSTGRRRIILTNYQMMPNLMKHKTECKYGQIKTGFLALDEAHLLKNEDVATSKMIFGDSQGDDGIQAEFKIIISGTPLENRPEDVFPYLRFMARGGSSDAEKMFESIDMLHFVSMFGNMNFGNLSQLHSYLSSRMIRRLKDDVVKGLPEKQQKIVKLNLIDGTYKIGEESAVALGADYTEQRNMYEMALEDPQLFEQNIVIPSKKEIEQNDDDMPSYTAKARQILRLQQCAIHPGIFGVDSPSIKYDATKCLIEERLKAGKSVLIFTEYRSAAKALCDFLSEQYKDTIAYVDGTITNGLRQTEVEKFQSGKAKIFIATVGTMGQSVELTQADTIIFLNYPWKPSTLQQAIDRAHRIDPKRNYPGKQLEVLFLEIEHSVSIDALKAMVIRKKKVLADMIIEGNLTPEILTAFKDCDRNIIDAINNRVKEEDIKSTGFETGLIEKFYGILEKILRENNPAERKRLWEQLAPIYFAILEQKGSFFANMANLDYLSTSESIGLYGRSLKTLDIGSGPSTLYRAYERRKEVFNERKFGLDITDYDVSPEMLRLGVPRQDRQVLGSIERIGEAFPPGSFDIINITYAYKYVSRPAQFIMDVRTLLKHGGVFTLVLPKSNVIPDRFYEALERAGFEIVVPRRSKLKTKLDDFTFDMLVKEYGYEFAKDIAADVRGEYTYLVAVQKRPVAGELNDDDFGITKTSRRTISPEKVRRLKDKAGRLKIIPEECEAEGKLDEFEPIVDGNGPAEKTYETIDAGTGARIDGTAETSVIDSVKYLDETALKAECFDKTIIGFRIRRIISLLRSYNSLMSKEARSGDTNYLNTRKNRVTKVLAREISELRNIIERRSKEFTSEECANFIEIFQALIIIISNANRLTAIRRDLEEMANALGTARDAVANIISVRHMEGLRMKEGKEGLWVKGKDVSLESNLDERKREIAVQSGKKVYTIDGKKVFISEELKTTCEINNVDLSWLEAYLQKQFKEYLPVKDKVYIDLLDHSQYLFEDHKQNGYIGINKQLFSLISNPQSTIHRPWPMDEKQALVVKLLKIGIRHELKHEFNTKKTEEELLSEDVIESVQLQISDKNIEFLKSAGFLDQKSNFFIIRDKLRVAWQLNAKTKMIPARAMLILKMHNNDISNETVKALFENEVIMPILVMGRPSDKLSNLSKLVKVVTDIYKDVSNKEPALEFIKHIVNILADIEDDKYSGLGKEAYLGDIAQAISGMYEKAEVTENVCVLIEDILEIIKSVDIAKNCFKSQYLGRVALLLAKISKSKKDKTHILNVLEIDLLGLADKIEDDRSKDEYISLICQAIAGLFESHEDKDVGLKMISEKALRPIRKLEEYSPYRNAGLGEIAKSIATLYKDEANKQKALDFILEILHEIKYEINEKGRYGCMWSYSNCLPEIYKAMAILYQDATDADKEVLLRILHQETGIYRTVDVYDQGKNLSGVCQAIALLYANCEDKMFAYTKIKEEAFKIAEYIEYKDIYWHTISILLNSIAIICKDFENKDDVLAFIEKFIDKAKSKTSFIRNLKDFLCTAYNSIAVLYQAHHNSEEALGIIKVKALEPVIAINDTPFRRAETLSSIYQIIAGLYKDTKDREYANKRIIEEAFSPALEIGILPPEDLKAVLGILQNMDNIDIGKECMEFMQKIFSDSIAIYSIDSFGHDDFLILPQDITDAYSVTQDTFFCLRSKYAKKEKIDDTYSIKTKIEALLTNHLNDIISYTIDLVKLYGDSGSDFIMKDLVSLTSKMGERGYKFTELIKDLDANEDDEMRAAIILQGMGYGIDNKGFITTPINLVTSVYRGSAEIDHSEAQYVTHSITTSLCHYARKGGEAAKHGLGEEVAIGNKALHEIDYALMCYEGVNGKQIDENVSLAFSFEKPLPQYSRKRTLQLQGKSAKENLEDIRLQQEREKLLEANILNILDWLSNGNIVNESIDMAIAKLTEYLSALAFIQNVFYYQALYGYMNDEFFKQIKTGYKQGEDNNALLTRLLQDAKEKQLVWIANIIGQQPRFDKFMEDLQNQNTLWKERGFNVIDYLKFKKRMRTGTYEEYETIDSIKLDDINYQTNTLQAWRAKYCQNLDAFFTEIERNIQFGYDKSDLDRSREVIEQLSLKPGQKYMHVGCSNSNIVPLLALYGVQCFYVDYDKLQINGLKRLTKLLFTQMKIKEEPDIVYVQDKIQDLFDNKHFSEEDAGSFNAISMFYVFWMFEEQEEDREKTVISLLKLINKNGGMLWFTPITGTGVGLASIDMEAYFTDIIKKHSLNLVLEKVEGKGIEDPIFLDYSANCCYKIKEEKDFLEDIRKIIVAEDVIRERNEIVTILRETLGLYMANKGRAINQGSVGRGTDLPGRYDIDLVALFKDPYEPRDEGNAVIEKIKSALEGKGYDVGNISQGPHFAHRWLLSFIIYKNGKPLTEIEITFDGECVNYVDMFNIQLDQIREQFGIEALESLMQDIKLFKLFLKSVVESYKRYHGGLKGVGAEQLIIQSGGASNNGWNINGVGSFAKAMEWIYRIGYDEKFKCILPFNERKEKMQIYDCDNTNFLNSLNEWTWRRLVHAARIYIEGKKEGRIFKNLEELRYSLKDAMSYRPNCIIAVELNGRKLDEQLDTIYGRDNWERVGQYRYFLFLSRKQEINIQGATVVNKIDRPSSELQAKKQEDVLTIIDPNNIKTGKMLVQAIKHILESKHSSEKDYLEYKKILITGKYILTGYKDYLNDDGLVLLNRITELIAEVSAEGYIWHKDKFDELKEIASQIPNIENPNEGLFVDVLVDFTQEQIEVLFGDKLRIKLTNTCSNKCAICNVSQHCGKIEHMFFPLAVKVLKRVKEIHPLIYSVMPYDDTEILDYHDRVINATFADFSKKAKECGYSHMSRITHGIYGERLKNVEEIIRDMDSGFTISFHVFHTPVINFAQAVLKGEIASDQIEERKRKIIKMFVDRFLPIIRSAIDNGKEFEIRTYFESTPEEDSALYGTFAHSVIKEVKAIQKEVWQEICDEILKERRIDLGNPTVHDELLKHWRIDMGKKSGKDIIIKPYKIKWTGKAAVLLKKLLVEGDADKDGAEDRADKVIESMILEHEDTYGHNENIASDLCAVYINEKGEIAMRAIETAFMRLRAVGEIFDNYNEDSFKVLLQFLRIILMNDNGTHFVKSMDRKSFEFLKEYLRANDYKDLADKLETQSPDNVTFVMRLFEFFEIFKNFMVSKEILLPLLEELNADNIKELYQILKDVPLPMIMDFQVLLKKGSWENIAYRPFAVNPKVFKRNYYDIAKDYNLRKRAFEKHNQWARELSRILGIDEEKMKRLLDSLDNAQIGEAIKNSFLSMINKDSIVTEGELEVLIKNINKVRVFLEDVIGEMPDQNRKEAIKRIALYLSILELKDKDVTNKTNVISYHINQLRQYITDLNLANSQNAGILIHKIMSSSWQIAFMYLRKIYEACPSEKRDELLQTIGSAATYIYIRQYIAQTLSVDAEDISTVTLASKIAKIIDGYLQTKMNKNKIAEIIARYITEGPEYMQIDKETEGSIKNIMSAKSITEVKAPDISTGSLEYTRNNISPDIFPDTKIILQDAGMYVSAEGAITQWDRENLSNNIINVIKQLLARNQLVFAYENDNQKENLIRLLTEKGIEQTSIVLVDMSICRNYDELKNAAEEKASLKNKELISMLCGHNSRFTGRNLMKDRIILMNNRIIDLYLAWGAVSLFANLDNEDFDENGNINNELFWIDLHTFLMNYYKNDITPVLTVNEIIQNLRQNTSFFVLPPISIFAEEYYEAIEISASLLSQSA